MQGIIVGMQKENEIVQYRIILYAKNADGEWQYNQQVANEQALIKALNEGKIKLDNAAVSNKGIKGTTGELSRFEADGFNPMVVMSEILTDGKTIGYKLATYTGKVTNVRLKDVLAYCARVNGKGAPLQNAMYVAEKDGKTAHIRAYPGQKFMQENIERKRSTEAKPAVIDKASNAKQVSKIEELFTPAQVEQLRIGKSHGVDIKIFGNNKLSANQMKELRLALEDGVNAKAFADPAYSVPAMKALRINAKYGVDITYFVNPKYNAEQIFELSTGYLSGVDLTEFSDTSLSANDMAKKRIYLESKLWNEVEATKI